MTESRDTSQNVLLYKVYDDNRAWQKPAMRGVQFRKIASLKTIRFFPIHVTVTNTHILIEISIPI